MELLIFMVAYVVCARIFAELLPIALEGAALLIQFLCVCFWESLKLIAKGAAWLAVHCARGVYWTCTQAGLFFFILFDEWRRGQRGEETGERFFEDEEPEEERGQDPYAAALERLGLTEPFSLADLKGVYRQKIKTAHTDVGGTDKAAAALNTARDLVMKVKGWK